MFGGVGVDSRQEPQGVRSEVGVRVEASLQDALESVRHGERFQSREKAFAVSEHLPVAFRGERVDAWSIDST